MNNTSSNSYIFSVDEGVARGNDALTLLDNNDTRNSFINELLEVSTYVSLQLLV